MTRSKWNKNSNEKTQERATSIVIKENRPFTKSGYIQLNTIQ